MRALALGSIHRDRRRATDDRGLPLRSFAPTNVTVRVHVTPNADNRGLEICAERVQGRRIVSVLVHRVPASDEVPESLPK